MVRSIKTCILFFIIPLNLYSQYQNIKFNHISVEQGLSNPAVKKIIQDRFGFIWIATEDGLNKYDGYTFTVYRNKLGDTTTISNNIVRTLYEDRSGELWIGTWSGGLHKFNREQENFTRLWPRKSSFKDSIISWSVVNLYESQIKNEDMLWIGSTNGLIRYDRREKKYILYMPEEDKRPEKFSNRITGITQDNSGNLWIATLLDGLFMFDVKTERFTRWPAGSTNGDKFRNRLVRSLYSSLTSGLDLLWVGTDWDGLYRIEPATGNISHYFHQPDDPNSLSNNLILSICQSRVDSSKILWIGTGNGLNQLNQDSNKITRYFHDRSNPGSLSSNQVNDIYEDESGVLWIGTNRGINKITPQKMEFKHLMDNFSITCIQESFMDGESIFWLGTENNGLLKLNSKTREFSVFLLNPKNKKDQAFPNKINSIIESSVGGNKILWLGTHNGLIKLVQKTNQYKHYYISENDPHTNIVKSIVQEQNGIIWVGTSNRYLFKFDPQTELFTEMGDRHIEEYLNIFIVFVDKKNNVWVGAPETLMKLNAGSGKFTRYKKQVYNKQVSAIYEDNDGIFWIGTSKGIVRFDPKTELFERYTELDGLRNHFIYGISEDDQAYLWISTNNGISKFNKKNKRFRNYDFNDGLLNYTFNYNAVFKRKNGELCFGGDRGLTIFHPGRLKDNPHIPKIVITDFQIFNKSILAGMDSPLDHAIYETKEITLSHDQSVFSFEFSALDYSAPEKNKYAYIMEGVDPDWVFTDASRRYATYTNLDPGEYTFRVKGSNNDGIWNEEGTSIEVIILPPWWKTKWAYAGYIILFGCILFAAWRIQVNRLRMKQQLEMEHFEADKLREVDQLKSRFFANISHEFRTPLTLIKGPLKQLLSGEFIGNIRETYKIMLRNSDRLLALINQILDLSRLESGEIKLQVAEIDIIPYLRGLVLTFSPLADRKKVTLKFTSAENMFIGYIDRDKLEKIITNLLSNTFKFTPEGGMIEVEVKETQPPLSPFIKGEIITSPLSRGDGGGCLKLSISNTGPGIPRDQIDKIFDRFYQADNHYKKDSEGSGIGLALTKELVEVCRGKISVSSIPGKTTTFVVRLPIAREIFGEDEVIEIPPLKGLKEPGTRIQDPEPRYQESRPKHLPPVDWPGSNHPGFDQQSVTSSEERTAKSEQRKAKDEQGAAAGAYDHTPSDNVAPVILLVEDNPDVTAYITSFMENEYRILTAENGKKGLKKVLDKYPDLIISDVMMPEMDGFEFCQKVKSDERISHIPVILLTAKADLESKIEGLDIGADDYVTKPFEARELQIRARNLIEQRRKLREKFSALIDLKPEDIAASSMDNQLLQRLLAVFEDHIEDPDFNLEHLSREIGMSRTHLNRKIRALTNLSSQDFIRTLRLKRAARLLQSASGTVSEIAYKVGFQNLSYFSKAFHKHFGKLPSDFSTKE